MTSGGNSTGVAIVGIACRFPGAVDHRAFWRNLCAGVESISSLTDDDLVAAGVPAEQLQNPAYVKAASLLPEIDLFDAAFFEYSPQEARLMDPQQRLLLEVAWEAFDDAGIRPGNPAHSVGVFVGSGGVVSSYLIDRLRFSAELPGFTGGLAHIGNDKDFLSTRISYKLNLTGPSINVQTACSTSLVAVHLACQAILSGECDAAIAGAATVRVPQRAGYLSVKGGILSPDGHCRAFDADAQGTVFGSGIGAVLLKDVSAAVADGDHIYAVIRGSAINNDGGDKISYTASSVAGQARAMVEAMSVAGISPNDIDYIECHGTGTIVGDPLEIDALSRAFRTVTDRKGFCAIGSVKTNIGHLEQTAGIAALIKAALALEHGKIPPSLNFHRPNPKIAFAASPFFVNTETRDWPAGNRPRYAAVNSLGLGGTNAFAILEEAPSPTAAREVTDPPPQHLFILSAKTASSLRASIERHRDWLDSASPTSLEDICFTLATGRTHFPLRFCAVAGSMTQLRKALQEAPGDVVAPASGQRRLAFLFSGQASQYASMAVELYRYQPVFRAFIDRCATILADRLGQPLLEVLFGEGDQAALINETAYTQPALFVVQAALVELWRSWGIVPDVVLGHSVGEFAAAYCAGVYTIEEALDLVTHRARLMQMLPCNGAMAAILADEGTVAKAAERLIGGELAIAAVNGPRNTVISGEREAVDAVIADFAERGVGSQKLTVSHAFHSPLMRPAMDEFSRIAAAVRGRAPKVTWISTASGRPVREAPDANYWRNHALEPVQFATGIRMLGELGVTDFIEIGPGRALLALGQQSLDGDERQWLGSLRKGAEWHEVLSSLGELYRHGYEIDWDGFNQHYSRRRVSLPTYPFEHRRYWIDDNEALALPTSASRASLRGLRLRSVLPDVQFESVYSLERFTYLDDHRIYGMPVLPTTVGLTVLREAAREHFGTEAVVVANLQYREAMILPQDGERLVQTILTPVDDATAEFRFASIGTATGETWQTHMVGVVRKDPAVPGDEAPAFPLDQVRKRCSTVIPIDQYYTTLRALGLEYGPCFRGIEMMQRGRDEVLTKVRLPTHLSHENGSEMHPALLDACLHVYPALVAAYGNFEHAPKELRCTYLPISVERFRSSGTSTREVWVHALRRKETSDHETLTIDISIYCDDGTFSAAIEGLSLKPLPPEALRPRSTPTKADWLYQIRWDERPALLTSDSKTMMDPSGWLILADRGGVGAALAEVLRQRGAICQIITIDDLVPPTNERSSWNPDDLTEQFTTVLTGFSDGHKLPLRAVINLWALDLPTRESSLDDLEAVQKIVGGGTVALFRSVVDSRTRMDAAPRIWLVSRNAVSVSADDPAAEANTATLWGLGRSAALEHPQLWGGLVDLGAMPDPSPSSDAEALLDEILRGDGEDQVALRAGRRFAARLVRVPLPNAAVAKFDVGGSYLITGGLGAVGMEVAKWLTTQRGVKHLILVSRRGQTDPNAEAARRILTALGAEVTIAKADMTKEADLRRLLSRITKSHPPLKGIFHCAGRLDDGVLLRMDWPKLQRVMAPKIAGAWLLHKLTRGLDLDHFVLFSSILSLIGSAGQANYAAANAFLDAFAAHRRTLGLPALALSFGPWAESGLATESGEKGRTIWRTRGTEYITAKTAWQAMDALFNSDLSHAAITLTDWPVFIQQFSNVPRLYEDLQREADPHARAVEPRKDPETFRRQLRQAPKTERHELLIAFVRQHAMKTLGIIDSIAATQPLRELGLDSLMSVTLVNRLEEALGIRISAAKLIQGPSIEQLVDDILPDFSASDGETIADLSGANRNGAGKWLVVIGQKTAPRLRLFCFPFAGGGSAVYRSWENFMDPAIEVVAIEPPGRLSRIEEQPVSDINEFVDKLVAEMQDLLDRPFAFFGHCLGGLTMYETARRIIHTTPLRPLHLFASGARPPDRISDKGSFEERLTRDLLRLAEFRINLPAYAQPDDVFAELIRHFNIRATEQLLSDPELRELMLPVIRAEFQMANNYEFSTERPWDIPITCFAARGDPYVSRQHALGWGRFTNSRLQVFMRDGAHFAVVDDMAFIHDVINRELQP